MPDCKPTIDLTREADREAGEIVNLISGGPDLTVLSYCAECGDVQVAWFSGEELRVAALPEEAIA